MFFVIRPPIRKAGGSATQSLMVSGAQPVVLVRNLSPITFSTQKPSRKQALLVECTSAMRVVPPRFLTVMHVTIVAFGLSSA